MTLLATGCFESAGPDSDPVDASTASDVPGFDVQSALDAGPIIFDVGMPDSGPRLDAGPPPVLDVGPPPPTDAGPPPFDSGRAEGALETACPAFCDAAVECEFEDIDSECTFGCLEFANSVGTRSCDLALAGFLECAAVLECRQLRRATMSEAGPCGMLLFAVEEECDF